MSKNTTDLNPIDGYLLELLANDHRRLCPTCLICDKDGIAFKNRKDTLQKIESLISNREREARIDENQRWLKTTVFGALTGDLEKRLAALQGEE